MSAANAQDVFLDGLIKGQNGAIGVGAYLGYYDDTEYDWRYSRYARGAPSFFQQAGR
ncbi:MAG: hypothetical protein LBU37_08070 [Tannerellaceae bacterium]|jgi:hypothetical protein|nr:hypothetical protein [Tannerellaceae bacterium]